MQRYFITLSFNGTHYHGWQTQDNASSIQQEIEHCLSLVLKDAIKVTGCGRTDTGVHARFFVAHFDFRNVMQDHEIQNMIRKMNMFLPEAIVIHDVIKVDEAMHARFSAKKRTYKYFISRQKNPFLRDVSYSYANPLNLRLMQLACKAIRQYDDFSSFSKTGGNAKTNICQIYQASWTLQHDQNMLIFSITADRFLRNMVRAIVGTMLDVGREKIALHDFRKIIESRERSAAGASIVAKGLFLWDIEYDGIELKKKGISTPMDELTNDYFVDE